MQPQHSILKHINTSFTKHYLFLSFGRPVSFFFVKKLFLLMDENWVALII